jgi:hypothetical protein
LAIYSKFVAGAIRAFCAVVRFAKGYTRRDVKSGVLSEQELDAFIRSALETLPERTDSIEEARVVLIAAGIITADGELAAEYRPAGDSGTPQD